MNEEEKKAIEYLKARLYGNEGCKYIDVAQEDLRIFINLVDRKEKDIEGWEKYCEEIEKEQTEMSNKNCELEFEVEKLQKENEELKEERQIVGIAVRNKRDGRIGIVLHQWKSGSVAVLESINPRVINTHDSWNTLEIVTDEVKQIQTKCETIPVSLVKDKIEEKIQEAEKDLQKAIELEKETKTKEDSILWWTAQIRLDERIKVLKEILAVFRICDIAERVVETKFES